MLKRKLTPEALLTMSSNIINLSSELEARMDKRSMTPKQEAVVMLRNASIERVRLSRAIQFHKSAYNERLNDFREITDRISLLEAKLTKAY